MRKRRWTKPWSRKAAWQKARAVRGTFGAAQQAGERLSRGSLSRWLPVRFVGTTSVFPFIWFGKFLSTSCSAYRTVHPAQGGLFQTCVVLVTPNKALSTSPGRWGACRLAEVAGSCTQGSAVARAAWRRRSLSRWHGTRHSPGIIPGRTAAAGELISLLLIFFLQALLSSFTLKWGCQLDQSEICMETDNLIFAIMIFNVLLFLWFRPGYLLVREPNEISCIYYP